MKRYRVCLIDFDSRARILSTEILDEWDEKVKEQWAINKRQIREYLISEYGAIDYEAKCSRLIELDVKPFSIQSYHNTYIDQIRDAYIVGAYYPALTGCCALGERILNHLILDLREDYPSENPEISDIYTCKSSTNWNVMIKALEEWNVFYEDVEDILKKLTGKRQRAIHFNAKLDLKDDSLNANEGSPTLKGGVSSQLID